MDNFWITFLVYENFVHFFPPLSPRMLRAIFIQNYYSHNNHNCVIILIICRPPEASLDASSLCTVKTIPCAQQRFFASWAAHSMKWKKSHAYTHSPFSCLSFILSCLCNGRPTQPVKFLKNPTDCDNRPVVCRGCILNPSRFCAGMDNGIVANINADMPAITYNIPRLHCICAYAIANAL